MTPTKDMLRPIDLEPLLGVSRGRIYQLIQSRALPCVRRGRSILIPRAAWERWLAAQGERALAAMGDAADERPAMPRGHLK